MALREMNGIVIHLFRAVPQKMFMFLKTKVVMLRLVTESGRSHLDRAEQSQCHGSDGKMVLLMNYAQSTAEGLE